MALIKHRFNIFGGPGATLGAPFDSWSYEIDPGSQRKHSNSVIEIPMVQNSINGNIVTFIKAT
jgi:hypothetical protein